MRRVSDVTRQALARGLVATSHAVRVQAAADVLTHRRAVAEAVLLSPAGLVFRAGRVVGAGSYRRLTADAAIVSISFEALATFADRMVLATAAHGVRAALVSAANVLALAQRVVLAVRDLGANLVLSARVVGGASRCEAAVLGVIGIAVQVGIGADAFWPAVKDLARGAAATLDILARVHARALAGAVRSANRAVAAAVVVRALQGLGHEGLAAALHVRRISGERLIAVTSGPMFRHEAIGIGAA